MFSFLSSLIAVLVLFSHRSSSFSSRAYLQITRCLLNGLPSNHGIRLNSILVLSLSILERTIILSHLMFKCVCQFLSQTESLHVKHPLGTITEIRIRKWTHATPPYMLELGCWYATSLCVCKCWLQSKVK